MEYIFVPFFIFYLHIVPVHIVWPVCIAYANGFAADGQKIGIPVELSDEIVPVVLVLERNKGFAGKVG